MKEQFTLLQLSHRVAPPAIDLATIAGMFFLVPWLGAQIFAQSPVNHFFLIPGFFLTVTGILAIRSLPSYSLVDSGCLSLVAACALLVVLLNYSRLYVYATDIGAAKYDSESVAVVIFLIFLCPVMVAFGWDTTNAKPGTGKALAANCIGLLSVNYLTLIGASVWYHFSSLPTREDPVYATGISFLILYGILYLLFLAFFGLPRIYLLRATGDKLGLTAYLVGVAVFLWDKVPPIN